MQLGTLQWKVGWKLFSFPFSIFLCYVWLLFWMVNTILYVSLWLPFYLFLLVCLGYGGEFGAARSWGWRRICISWSQLSFWGTWHPTKCTICSICTFQTRDMQFFEIYKIKKKSLTRTQTRICIWSIAWIIQIIFFRSRRYQVFNVDGLKETLVPCTLQIFWVCIFFGSGTFSL